MSQQCPLITRVESLEQTRKGDAERMAVLEYGHERHERTQEKMSATLETMCRNVGRLADNVDKLVEIIPLITMAQTIRTIAIWVTPIVALIGLGWGGYWALAKVMGWYY